MLEAAREQGGRVAEEGDDIDEFLKRRRIVDIITTCETVAANEGDVRNLCICFLGVVELYSGLYACVMS